MKRILGLTTAALLGASILAAPAMAIELDAGTSGSSGIETTIDAQSDLDSGANTTMPDVDGGTTAAIGATFEGALTAIDGNAATTQSISTMTEVRDVRIISISDLEGHDAGTVEQAVTGNQAGIDELRAAIDANAALSQELQTQGVDSSGVVAAQVGADGAVTMFVM